MYTLSIKRNPKMKKKDKSRNNGLILKFGVHTYSSTGTENATQGIAFLANWRLRRSFCFKDTNKFLITLNYLPL